MTNAKPWWQSLTVWGILAVFGVELLAYAAEVLGWPAPDGLRQVAQLLAGGVAVAGRARADRPLGGGR